MTVPKRKDLLSIETEHFLQEERFDLAYSTIILEPEHIDIVENQTTISFLWMEVLGFWNILIAIQPSILAYLGFFTFFKTNKVSRR